MLKHLRLLFLFFKNNLARETEFRGNFLLWIFTDLCWVSLQIILIGVYYSFTSSISGWSLYQFLVLAGLFRMIKGVFDTFFRLNLTRFPEYIDRGDLDYSLTRPVNALFIISSRYHIVSESFSFIAGIFIILYAVTVGHLSFSILQLIILILLVIVAVSVFYSLVLVFSCLAFFVTRLTAMSSYYDVLSTFLRVPTDVYTARRLDLFFLLLPFVAVVTLPSKILLNMVPQYYFFLELLLTIAIFSAAYKFWLFSLRHYSSASS